MWYLRKTFKKKSKQKRKKEKQRNEAKPKITTIILMKTQNYTAHSLQDHFRPLQDIGINAQSHVSERRHLAGNPLVNRVAVSMSHWRLNANRPSMWDSQ